MPWYIGQRLLHDTKHGAGMGIRKPVRRRGPRVATACHCAARSLPRAIQAPKRDTENSAAGRKGLATLRTIQMVFSTSSRISSIFRVASASAREPVSASATRRVSATPHIHFQGNQNLS
jgi:hypothetical protein